MVVDPATLTLGALHLFEPIFKAGKALYDGWELTKAFPSDMNRAAWRLKMHYLIFARKSELLVGDLCYPFDPGNEFNPATKTLLYSLNVVLGLFEECDKLILKYQPQGKRPKEYYHNYIESFHQVRGVSCTNRLPKVSLPHHHLRQSVIKRRTGTQKNS